MTALSATKRVVSAAVRMKGWFSFRTAAWKFSLLQHFLRCERMQHKN